MTHKTVNDIDTPLMNQYRSIKKNYKDEILFFRLGDFYEMFDEDAKIASKVLSLMLTQRHGVLMCGVPYHSSMNYIAKLINHGYKVAICEQVGEGEKSNLFKRKVVRVITGGTLIEENLLNAKSTNYLLGIVIDLVGWGASWIDISTGEFYAINKLDDTDFNNLFSLISRISPKEIVIDLNTQKYINKDARLTFLNNRFSIFNPDYSELSPWQENPVWKNNKLATKSAMLVLSYLKSLQPDIVFEPSPSYFDDNSTLKLDETAIKTLELVESQYDGYSLFDVLDYSKTSMGCRLLKKWILNPLTDYFLLKSRIDAVDFFYKNEEYVEKIREIIGEFGDIERITGRIINLSILPRDLINLKKSIKKMNEIVKILDDGNFISVIPDIVRKLKSIGELNKLCDLIESSINENSSMKVGEGDLFKMGYNKDYDELKNLIDNSQKIISEMEQQERDKTSIPSLKIGYNNNFGYYIEVTKPHISKIPQHYIRKQTLVSCERFITQQLKEVEEKILSASEKIKKLELSLYLEIKKEVLKYLDMITSYAFCLSNIDGLASLSIAARRNNYVKPQIVNENVIEIENGRHPVVEKFLSGVDFVPNDLKIDEELRTIILTGPNMSGKSVYLRQNALIVIMAQMGSFVPADRAKIGLVDRIMTRMGAHDRLVKGESTFMVEMKETSNILRLATDRSLILLDEVGRGTSTYDGVSIAYAVLEYIHTKIRAKVLFATHFFEITEISRKYNGIKNFNVLVKQWLNNSGKIEVSFLHKIVEGSSDKSYGVHVAEIAGLPSQVIKRANEILKELESKNITKEQNTEMLPLFESNPIIEKIKMLDVNKITPVDALNILNELKRSVNQL